MYMQYKCLCRVNSLLFMNNSKPHLPSLITESDSQYTTRSAAIATSFDYLNTIGQLMKNISIMLQPNYGIIYIG